MSANVDIERTLEVWFAGGPTAMPLDLRDVVAGRIGYTRQRSRRWPWTWTWPRIQNLAAAVGALVIAGVLGLGLFSGSLLQPARPTPSAFASPSPAATASPAATGPTGTLSRPLAPGTHTSTTWQPPLSFSVPTGWRLDDQSPHLSLVSDEGVSLDVFRDVYPPKLDSNGCAIEPDFANSPTPFALVRYLDANTHWTADSAPVGLGGLQGWTVDLTVDALDGLMCARQEAPLFAVKGPSGAAPQLVASGPGLTWRLIALDDRNDGTILIRVPVDPAGRPSADAQAIVDTFTFDLGLGPTPSAPRGLTSGTHSNSIWAPALEFTVGDGWRFGGDRPAHLSLTRGVDFNVTIDLYWNAYAPQLDDNGCWVRIDWAAPHSAQDLVDYLSSEGLSNPSVAAVSLGGLTGWRVTGTGLSETGRRCPTPPQFVVHDGDELIEVSAWEDQPATFVVLDDTHGHTIVIDSRDNGREGPPQNDDVIASFDFDPTCAGIQNAHLCDPTGPTSGGGVSSRDTLTWVEIPAGAADVQSLSVLRSGPAAYPRELRDFDYDLDLYSLETSETDFAAPVTVRRELNSADFGFGYEGYPEIFTATRPIPLLAIRTTDGSWRWLDDQQLRFGWSTVVVTGTTTSPGQIFAFLGGTSTGGNFAPAPSSTVQPHVEGCAATWVNVGGLAGDSALFSALGLPEAMARLTVQYPWFQHHCAD